MNSPNRKKLKLPIYGSPIRGKDIYGSPAPSSPTKLNISRYQLDKDFKSYLNEKISFLKDNVYNLLIQYCLIINTPNDKNKYKYILDNLTEIDDVLLILFRTINLNNINLSNVSVSVLKENKVYLINNRIIKKHSINSHSLIETFINCILYYYSSKNGYDSIIDSSLHFSRNSFFHQSMSLLSNGIVALDQFIKNLYENLHYTTERKNNILLLVLKRIAHKLLELQNICCFIHGDFHSGNIFIKYINDDNIIITFIDFGYSSVKLPIENHLILSTPIPENIDRSYPMDISKEEYLKAVDLFNLIENLVSYNLMNSKNYFNNFDQLILFILKIQKLYMTPQYKSNRKDRRLKNFFSSRQKFCSSNIFQNINYKALYPENFMNINYVDDKIEQQINNRQNEQQMNNQVNNQEPYNLGSAKKSPSFTGKLGFYNNELNNEQSPNPHIAKKSPSFTGKLGFYNNESNNEQPRNLGNAKKSPSFTGKLGFYSHSSNNESNHKKSPKTSISKKKST